uniref:hypothetical protein n=1 Tax=Candidatus Electronema sp. TaxID=2698783 RepID=UPI004056CFC4
TLSIMSVFHDVHAVTAAASVSDDFLYHHPILTHHLLFCHYPFWLDQRRLSDSLSRQLQTTLPSLLPGSTIQLQNTGVRCCVRRFFLANLKQEPERHVRRPAGNSF